MALEEDRPGAAFPVAIGRTFDQSSLAWPQPLRAHGSGGGDLGASQRSG
jgi:hypothetical protein